jgi:hypothetical protein
MTSRRASDGGSVLSFTFLDVLMCTMGSLLLLLVVFGVIAKKATRQRRAGEVASFSLAALGAPSAPPTAASNANAAEAPSASTTDPDDLARELEELRRNQAELERRRAAAAERRSEEQQRISHLEDHERRLEHELAKLHATLKALADAEQKQSVDQDQADAEVVRLKELIRETEARLADMRKNGPANKSYAIVPYKGANGTTRRPVFVECTAEAVTIQPEGIRLTVADFDGPLRSGNPLAAAIRAAHEELNGRAAAAGQVDMPDPYPLFIVRPDGSAAYATALDAIRSWDSDYGYEFVEADWKLKYPEPDPRLSQVMAHAVDEARQRQALLARVAPRTYAPRLTGGGSGGGGAGNGLGGAGFGALAAGGAGNRIGAHAGDGALGEGDGEGGRYGNRNALRRGSRGGSGGNFSDEFAETGSGGGAGGNSIMTAAASTDALNINGQSHDGPGGKDNSGSTVAGGSRGGANASGGGASPAADGGRYAQQAGQPGAAARGADQSGMGPGDAELAGNSAAGANSRATSAAGTDGAAGGSLGSAAGASGSGAAGATGANGSGSSAGAAASGGGGVSLPSMQLGAQRRGSAADARGANWANAEASRRAAAVTRPIKVTVGAQQLAVGGAIESAGDSSVVPFNQPVDDVLDQLAAAIQEQIADWGIAGDGMYWRPTLVVAVESGAQRQAERLAELLEDSGVDVRLPQATASAPRGGDRATR